MSKIQFTAALSVSIALCLTGFGCSKELTQESRTPVGGVALTTTPTVVQITSATAAQCPTGGVVVVEFADVGGTGQLTTGDTVISENPICNGAAGAAGTTGATGATGAAGAQGQGAGIQVVAAASGACPASGVQITTFVDSNNNGVLDSSEQVTSVSTVCNGVAGTNGADGTNGTNGQSAYISAALASAAQCASGGVVYTATSPGSDPMVSVICNGASGTNGANGTDGTNGANGTNAVFETGPVGGAVAGEPFTACHHDYLYIPDETGGSRGWLMFRHQENGSADEGIGSTGFQVWDVDITSFELASEVGSVVYCSLEWNPTARQLGYTVIDNTNGLGGQSGTIQL